jgi:predicted ribosome quality control (RQC) complex YloA/Tae2 family protein
MLSLKEVRRVAEVLQKRLCGARLQRAVQLDEFRLILEFYSPPATQLLLLSCRPAFARLGSPRELPQAPKVPPAFVQYLRAHADRTILESVAASSRDRLIKIRLAAHEGFFEIVLSIVGPRSNIYLLDGKGVLLYFMRPLSETRRALSIGQPWTDPEGGPRTEGEDRWAAIPDEAYPEAIEDTYAALEEHDEAEVLTRKLEAVIGKETEFLERKAGNLLQDLGDAVRAEEYRRKGELLKLALHEISPGADSITVPDYETGNEVEIPLDSRLSATENLNSYFKRYQKELRSARALEEQLAALRTAQSGIAGYQQRVWDLRDAPAGRLASLTAIAAEPRMRKLLARHYREPRPRISRPAPAFPGKPDLPGKLRPRRFRTESELEIWVGRSEEGNDYLTTRLARGNDLFFHLEGYPGSHVILRTGGSASPPPEAMLCACELAVHYSKMKEARHADVHVAPVKNVRKPKGAKPGLVYVTGGKTIHLRRDPKRLENILAARVEEGE